MRSSSKFFVIVMLLFCLTTSMAGAAVFPIERKVYDSVLYMPKRVYLAWKNGSPIDGNFVMKGGETKEIFVDVRDTNGNGTIDVNDFDASKITRYAVITSRDMGLADYLDNIGVTSTDLNEHSYDWLLQNISSDSASLIEASIDQFSREVANKVKVSYSLTTEIGGDDPNAISTSSPLVARTENVEEVLSHNLNLTHLAIGSFELTALQQKGDQNSEYQPEFATLKTTIGVVNQDTNNGYVSGLPCVTRATPVITAEIRASDSTSNGGGCDSGFSFLSLLTLLLFLFYKKEIFGYATNLHTKSSR